VTVAFESFDNAAKPAVGTVAPSNEAAGSFRPLASITLRRRNLIPGRPYDLHPLTDGVAGWIVFGAGATTATTVRFDSARDAMLHVDAASPYRSLNVKSLRRDASQTSLTGLVRLEATSDLELLPADRTIDGTERRVILFRIKPETPDDRMIELAGPCGRRPAEDTCAKPALQTVNGVAPDANGDLRIRLGVPDGESLPFTDDGGLVLVAPDGTRVEECPPTSGLPDPEGKSLFDIEETCGTELPPSDPPPPDPPPPDPPPSCDDSDYCMSPPTSGLPEGWIFPMGSWDTAGDEENVPDYDGCATPANAARKLLSARSLNQLNVGVRAIDLDCPLLDRRIKAVVRAASHGDPASNNYWRNAGLVLGYHLVDTGDGQHGPRFWFAGVNAGATAYEIWSYDSRVGYPRSERRLAVYEAYPDLVLPFDSPQLDHPWWFSVDAAVRAHPTDTEQIRLLASFERMELNDAQATIFLDLPKSDFPENGALGAGTLFNRADFSEVEILRDEI